MAEKSSNAAVLTKVNSLQTAVNELKEQVALNNETNNKIMLAIASMEQELKSVRIKSDELLVRSEKKSSKKSSTTSSGKEEEKANGGEPAKFHNNYLFWFKHEVKNNPEVVFRGFLKDYQEQIREVANTAEYKKEFPNLDITVPVVNRQLNPSEISSLWKLLVSDNKNKAITEHLKKLFNEKKDEFNRNKKTPI